MNKSKSIWKVFTILEFIRINKEVVEGVKFQFLNKGLLKQFTPKKQNIVTFDELQEQGKIYSNAEELLNEILKNKQYKHFQHIQYFADRHESKSNENSFCVEPIFICISAFRRAKLFCYFGKPNKSKHCFQTNPTLFSIFYFRCFQHEIVQFGIFHEGFHFITTRAKHSQFHII